MQPSVTAACAEKDMKYSEITDFANAKVPMGFCSEAYPAEFDSPAYLLLPSL